MKSWRKSFLSILFFLRFGHKKCARGEERSASRLDRLCLLYCPIASVDFCLNDNRSVIIFFFRPMPFGEGIKLCFCRCHGEFIFIFGRFVVSMSIELLSSHFRINSSCEAVFAISMKCPLEWKAINLHVITCRWKFKTLFFFMPLSFSPALGISTSILATQNQFSRTRLRLSVPGPPPENFHHVISIKMVHMAIKTINKHFMCLSPSALRLRHSLGRKSLWPWIRDWLYASFLAMIFGPC